MGRLEGKYEDQGSNSWLSFPSPVQRHGREVHSRPVFRRLRRRCGQEADEGWVRAEDFEQVRGNEVDETVGGAVGFCSFQADGNVEEFVEKGSGEVRAGAIEEDLPVKGVGIATPVTEVWKDHDGPRPVILIPEEERGEGIQPQSRFGDAMRSSSETEAHRPGQPRGGRWSQQRGYQKPSKHPPHCEPNPGRNARGVNGTSARTIPLVIFFRLHNFYFLV